MREIKFRAFWRDTLKPVENFNTEYLIDACNNDMFIVMQFTGLHDKNGKEIWEGDILSYSDPCDDECLLNLDYRIRGVVNFIEERSALMPQEIIVNSRGGHYISNWRMITDVEIIGNIYENPDLLTKEA